MNLIKKLLVSGALIAATVIPNLARAEGGRGYDMFGATKAILLLNTNVTIAVGATNSYTFDKSGCVGVAAMFIGITTNAWLTNATQTNIITTSADQTNWVNVPYALGIPYSQITSNFLYGISGYTTNSGTTPATTNGTGIQATNFLSLPGTPTTPSIASAGFGTPYSAATAMTNTNSITVTNNQATWVGFNIDDCSRYIRLQAITLSNVGISSLMIAAKTGN